jgi:hypothetical protein
LRDPGAAWIAVLWPEALHARISAYLAVLATMRCDAHSSAWVAAPCESDS